MNKFTKEDISRIQRSYALQGKSLPQWVRDAQSKLAKQ